MRAYSVAVVAVAVGWVGYVTITGVAVVVVVVIDAAATATTSEMRAHSIPSKFEPKLGIANSELANFSHFT
jgi:hypothetical protein